MRELEIKLVGQINLGELVVSIDNKPVKLKKYVFGCLICKYQTGKDKVNIKVYRMLDVGGFIWFLTQIFFYLISIFGIFDVRRKERCFVVDFETEIDLKDQNKITLQLNNAKENEQAINVQTDLDSHEISNKYYLDYKAKKTLKVLKITKVLLTLAIMAIVIVVFMNKL